LTELPGFVFERLSNEIQKGAMWARFGKVICQSAPHRRAAGLVAVGIDRLILPANEDTGGVRAGFETARKSSDLARGRQSGLSPSPSIARRKQTSQPAST
jgi:hypothetical protein